jgi:hypothetical protein
MNCGLLGATQTRIRMADSHSPTETRQIPHYRFPSAITDPAQVLTVPLLEGYLIGHCGHHLRCNRIGYPAIQN